MLLTGDDYSNKNIIFRFGVTLNLHVIYFQTKSCDHSLAWALQTKASRRSDTIKLACN